jgi:hypothetical protein
MVYRMPAAGGAIEWVATSAAVALRVRVVGQTGPAMPFLSVALRRAADVRDPGLREKLTGGGEACLSAAFRNLVCGPN